MNRILLLIFATLLLCSKTWADDFETATDAVKHMGLGWNLGNTLDANNQKDHDPTQASYWGQQDIASESCWGQFTTKAELFAMMKDAGFGAIRVPITWYNHMDMDGNVDEAWMNRVCEVVDAVISQGLYCIINVHHDTGADRDGFKSMRRWPHKPIVPSTATPKALSTWFVPQEATTPSAISSSTPMLVVQAMALMEALVRILLICSTR